MPSGKMRVAVIGGGVAGLVVARHVVARPELYDVCLFEQTDKIGGTWVYTDETELDRNGLPVHSSMYKNLRTNLPKEIMQIPDFPFAEKKGPSFVHHSVIRQYLEDYAQHFKLYPHVKLNHLIEHVEPKKLANGQVIWQVSYLDLATRIRERRTFDAVFLCNGHYTVGNVPEIEGIESFPGSKIHSHQYRQPEQYAGKSVCILGASWSGIDICLEVHKHARRVYISHNLAQELDVKIASNVDERPGIERCDGSTFYFRDGSSAQVDVLIYCTGYHFTYPFLSDKVRLSTEDNHVEPIYKHLVHMDWPSLFFMGLPAIVIPFPMFHVQAQFLLAVLEGRARLPPRELMYQEYEAEKQSLLKEGVALRHINKMCKRQWAYYDEIAKAAGCPAFKPVVRKIYEHCNKMRDIDFTTYKNYMYSIVDDENFEVAPCKGLC
ncbi:hypothetical protein TKK_0010510 [Trichogramma kaykai]|uniref:Flavin-containing monooxygenase n=1 Tax=Trichogramma kaykai TaxID=54128 RepID=A0ABD2WWM2_9HYME